MTTFRTGRSGKRHPITPRMGTLYGEARHPSIARDTHAGSIDDARTSTEQLQRDFDRASPEKKREIYEAVNEEANRLEVDAHNTNNSPATRHNLSERADVFRSKAHHLHAELYPE